MVATVLETNKPPQAKRRVKNFLIDSRFQLGWVFRVAIVTAIVVGVMGYFLYGTLSESLELVKMEAMSAEGMTLESQTAILEQGEKDKLVTLTVLGSGLLGIVILLSLMTVVATHKIAGPAYKMKKLFGDIDGANLQLWAKLRKGDQLHDVFVGFEDMLRRLRESRHEDLADLEPLIESLKSGGPDPEAIVKLERIVTKFQDSVKMR